MNTKFHLSVALGVLLGTPGGFAIAHTQDGSLGAGATATDFYQVTCSDDGSGAPASMIFQIQNRSPGSSAVSVVAQKGNVAGSSTDTVAGDVDQSPLNWINGGEGVYNVFVLKAADGGVNYTLTYHCYTAPNGGGIHTGTTIVVKQNQ